MDILSNLITSEIRLFIYVLLGISTIASILRWVLWSQLGNLYKDCKKLSKDLSTNLFSEGELIENLIARFEVIDLEKVNAISIIDAAYREQKIGKFSYELIENFCGILPNLLISFGLVGTFLGLTLNLSNLIPTLTNSDTANLVDQLRKPLQGMAIAFISSLVALVCAASLNIFNLIFNTNRLKFQIFNYLEDYFENICLGEKATRLDKSIEKMTSQFDDFLTRFSIVVRESIEYAFEKPAQEIRESNERSSRMAEEIGLRFTDASGTIANSANSLREAGELFQNTNFPERLYSASQELQKAESNIAALGDIMNGVNHSLIEVSKISDQVQNLIISNQKLQQVSVDILQAINNERLSINIVVDKVEEGINRVNKTVNEFQEQLAGFGKTIHIEKLINVVENSIELGDKLNKQQDNQIVEFVNLREQLQEFTKTFGIQVQDLVKEIHSENNKFQEQLAGFGKTIHIEKLINVVENSIKLGDRLNEQQNNQIAEFINLRGQLQELLKVFSSQTQELSKNIRSSNDLSDRLTNKIDKQTEELRNINYVSQLSEQNKILQKLDQSVTQVVTFLETKNL